MEAVSSILVKTRIFILSSVAERRRENVSKLKFNHWLTSCKSAELASRLKFVRRELGRDGGRSFVTYMQDGDSNVAVEGKGNLAR